MEQDKLLYVLLAWEAGELTEGQAARLTGKSHVDLRFLRDSALDVAKQMWSDYRKHHSPKHRKEEV